MWCIWHIPTWCQRPALEKDEFENQWLKSGSLCCRAWSPVSERLWFCLRAISNFSWNLEDFCAVPSALAGYGPISFSWDCYQLSGRHNEVQQVQHQCTFKNIMILYKWSYKKSFYLSVVLGDGIVERCLRANVNSLKPKTPIWRSSSHVCKLSLSLSDILNPMYEKPSTISG